MSYIRWSIELAVKEPITKELEKEMGILKERLSHFQKQCEKINEGKVNEENTTKMKEHICCHDESKPCHHLVNIVPVNRKDKERIRYDTVGKFETLVWIPLKRSFMARRK